MAAETNSNRKQGNAERGRHVNLEQRMSQGLLLLGCFLSLRGYGVLAVFCWAAGAAWKKGI